MLHRISKLYRSFVNIPFVQDIFTMQVGQAIYTTAAFAGSIAFARILGVHEYGIYTVTFAFVSTIKVFTNLGQGNALQIFFAEEWGKKHTAGMARVLRNYLNVSVVNACLLGALAIVAPHLSNLFYDEKMIGLYASLLFIFHILEVGNGGCNIILQAIRKIRLKTILEQSANTAILLCSVVAILLGYGIWGIIMSHVLVSAIFLIINFSIYRFLLRSLPLPGLQDVLHVKNEEAQPYLQQGLLFAIDKNVGNLYPSSLYFVLSLVAPPAIVGITRIAMRFTTLPQVLLLSHVGSLSETVLASVKAEGVRTLRKNVAKVIKHSLFFNAIFASGLLAVIPFVIPFLYGPEYESAIPIAMWLIVGTLLMPIGIINSPLLRLYRKILYSTAVGIISLLVQWASLYILATLLSPEIGFIVAYTVGYLITLPLTWYIFRTLLRCRHT